MKIAIGQINPVVGDISYNTGVMLRYIERAKMEQADLIVFPELAAVGYPPKDLLLRPEVPEGVQEALKSHLQPASREIGVILGAPVRDTAKSSLYNSALFFKLGSLMGRQDKTLLPNYDVFDEKRYFAEASLRQPVTLKGLKIGVTICEDVWNDKDYWGEARYDLDPVRELADKGADIIVNIAASPYSFGKRKARAEMLSAIARKYGKTVVYVNQVGGNDELIFDGSSMVFDRQGHLTWQGKAFAEDFAVVDVFRKTVVDFQVKEGIDCIHDALVLGIRDYVAKTGFSKVVIGLSGGIDSAVTAALAVKALGSENVLGVALPSQYSSTGSVADAHSLAKNLAIQLREISIEEVFNTFITQLNGAGNYFQDTAEENLQARIRGGILMFISNREGHLLLSTGNKSEMAVGYSTLYGDMSGGLCPLGDVPKTTVYQLARYINRRREIIPQSTMTKAPSAELRPGQKDEDSLPPYEVLDSILKCYIEDNLSLEEIEARGYDSRLVREIIRKVDRSEYKRKQAPLVLRVTAKSFGPGRRFPIAWRRS